MQSAEPTRSSFFTMKTHQIISMAFGTGLSAHQLNLAIRMGALLHGGEVSFQGKPGSDDRLIITCSGLTVPFIAEYGYKSVKFHFAESDRSMLTCIRGILVDGLIFEVPAKLKVQITDDSLDFDRVSA